MDQGERRGWWVGAIGCGGTLLLVAVLGWRLYVAEHRRSAKEIVAAKISQFGENRRKIAAALAKRAGVEVPADVTRFFDAVAAGDWPEIDQLLTELSGSMHGEGRRKDLEACWPAVMDTFGCVDEAHKWPAEKLLDYADAVLGPLHSGMVYVGGTDPGRFIPTLVNETSSGEQHVVITQNALADRLYLDYIGFLYGDRMAALTQQEQESAFSDYIADAKRRLEHDLKFPDEPKQIEPGESVRFKDGEVGDVVAEGAISVMAVNERLLRRLMEKNPEMGFALEESFPMKTTYPGATTLGPIMELRASGGGSELTREKADQAVAYWRQRSEELLSDNEEGAQASSVLAPWAKMATAQGNLFAQREMYNEAEEAYELARRIFPGSPEAMYGLANLMARRGDIEKATELVQEFQAGYGVREPPVGKFPKVEAPKDSSL
jgi:hypothetical protein